MIREDKGCLAADGVLHEEGDVRSQIERISGVEDAAVRGQEDGDVRFASSCEIQVDVQGGGRREQGGVCHAEVRRVPCRCDDKVSIYPCYRCRVASQELGERRSIGSCEDLKVQYSLIDEHSDPVMGPVSKSIVIEDPSLDVMRGLLRKCARKEQYKDC